MMNIEKLKLKVESQLSQIYDYSKYLWTYQVRKTDAGAVYVELNSLTAHAIVDIDSDLNFNVSMYHAKRDISVMGATTISQAFNALRVSFETEISSLQYDLNNIFR